MLCLAWAIAPPGNIPIKHHGYTVVFLRAWHWVADATGLVYGGRLAVCGLGSLG